MVTSGRRRSNTVVTSQQVWQPAMCLHKNRSFLSTANHRSGWGAQDPMLPGELLIDPEAGAVISYSCVSTEETTRLWWIVPNPATQRQFWLNLVGLKNRHESWKRTYRKVGKGIGVKEKLHTWTGVCPECTLHVWNAKGQFRKIFLRFISFYFLYVSACLHISRRG